MAGGTFTEGAGTTSGDDVLIDGGAVLHFTGSGSSTFDLRSDQGGNTISGSAIAAVQTVHLECGSVATLAGSMSSAGTIDFHNNACGSIDRLVIPGGSILTNTGLIEATGCCGGARELTGSVTNRGATPLTLYLKGRPIAFDVVVRRMRAKVDDPFQVKLVHTVRGVGYVLKTN